MQYTIGPRTTFEALETADYRITLKAVQEVTETEDSEFSKKGDIKVQWAFLVSVPAGDDVERRVRTAPPATFSEKSTFNHIIVALGLVDEQKAIDETTVVDPEQGIGRSCMATIVKQLKRDKKTWTDTFKAFFPLPTEAAPAKSKGDMATKLRERLNTLLAFSGETSDAPADLDQKALANALKVIGAKPITAKATQYLTESIELANTMGINDFDDSAILGLTLKDALLLHEKITARLDA